MNIDALTVLHKKSAVQLYAKCIKLFQEKSSGKINLNFKVSCDIAFKDILPDFVEIFKYEKVKNYAGKPSGIDHAYNMQTLLRQVETEWFVMMDPDVFPVVEKWDDEIFDLFKTFDVFGIPYCSNSTNRYYDFPMIHLCFFKSLEFFSVLNNNPDSRYISKVLMPLGSKKNPIINGKSLTRPYDVSEEVLFDYNSNEIKKYKEMYGSNAVPDTAWMLPVLFQGLKRLVFDELPLSLKEISNFINYEREVNKSVFRPSFKFSYNNKSIFAHIVYGSNSLK